MNDWAITNWVIWLIDAGGYWGIALLMVIENIFPPIPSELIMGVGGIRVGQGRLEMLPLLVAGTIGTTVGNYCWYLVGLKLGMERLRPLVDRFGRWATVEWEDVERLNRLFEKHGQIIVFVLRFMPTFRTMISLPAGLFRMGHIRFLLWTAAGSFIWNIVLAGAGFYLGHNFRQIDDYIGPAATATIAVVAVLYIWRLFTWKPSSRK